MIPKVDWQAHSLAKRHMWLLEEVKEGLSWGALSNDCFDTKWEDYMDKDSWWLYEFAIGRDMTCLDRSRIFGQHAWTNGLPLTEDQMQLLVPSSSVALQPQFTHPFWMDGGALLSLPEEVGRARSIMDHWKTRFPSRLGVKFLLVPGHRVFALEYLMRTQKWVKARFSEATRITGVRKMNLAEYKEGEDRTNTRLSSVQGVVVYEVKYCNEQEVEILKLSGAGLTLQIPDEAKYHDFWLGSWILQQANLYWKLPPRSPAVLTLDHKILHPWANLREIRGAPDLDSPSAGRPPPM